MNNSESKSIKLVERVGIQESLKVEIGSTPFN